MKCPRFVWAVLRKFPLLTRLAASTQPPWDSKRRTVCQRVLPVQLVSSASSCESCLGALPGLNCWHSLHQQWARGKSRVSLLCLDHLSSLPPGSTFLVWSWRLCILHFGVLAPSYFVLPPADVGEGWRGTCHSPCGSLHVIRTCDDKMGY